MNAKLWKHTFANCAIGTWNKRDNIWHCALLIKKYGRENISSPNNVFFTTYGNGIPIWTMFGKVLPKTQETYRKVVGQNHHHKKSSTKKTQNFFTSVTRQYTSQLRSTLLLSRAIETFHAMCGTSLSRPDPICYKRMKAIITEHRRCSRHFRKPTSYD